MSEIGILSMQRIINYGSFLQGYGLKSMLEELGHNVEFVDYRVGAPLVADTSNKKGGKLGKALEALSYDAPLSHRIKFILYKKNFAKKYHDILGLTAEPNYTPKLDTLVIGSDEVFNCVQKNPNVGYSTELFGANNNAKKLVTYAASFGNTTIEKLDTYGKKDEIAGLLNKFDAISVRDNNSGDIVTTLTNKEVIYHLDPVLAYDYMGKPGLIPDIKTNEKYMILYAYSGRISSDEAKWISSYAKSKGLKIYAIGGVQKFADKFIDCSPFEVLGYFKNAECVITDTFHGSIFSIITKSNFATLVRKSHGTSYGNEEKLTDLLNRLKASDRMCYDINDASAILDKEIDYGAVFEVIKDAREATKEYLSKI